LKLLGTGITDDLRHVLSSSDMDGISLHTTENLFRGYVITTATRNK
jgi:hypothetical protein